MSGLVFMVVSTDGRSEKKKKGQWNDKSAPSRKNEKDGIRTFTFKKKKKKRKNNVGEEFEF